jgi:hypothetical protein
MMNLYRGFKRITLLLSIVVTLAAWFWFSEGRFRSAEQKQKALEEDAEQYRCFWDCWDADDFLGASKRMVVADLLTGPDKLKAVIVPNGDDARVLFLAPDVVFPGIESLRVHLDTVTTGYGRLLMSVSDSALEEAAQAAKAKCLALEPRFSRHFVRSPREMLTSSILEGGPVAAGTFGAVWLLFLLFRWIVCGFYGGVAKTGKTQTETGTPAIVPEVPNEYDSAPLTHEAVRSARR